MRRRRRGARRLLGLLLLVVLLELALQAAAPIVQGLASRGGEIARPETALSILCVGDSNTFGLHVPRAWSYPEQLRARLAPRYEQPVVVFNRGVPGQNTAQVAAHLDEDLAASRPALVLVLAGINDTWNDDAEGAGVLGRLAGLRLVRLVRVLLAGVTTARPFEVGTDAEGEIVVDRGEGARRVNAAGASIVRSGEELARRLRAGLSEIVTRCRDHGALPVLMTYPEFQGEFATANAGIRALAAELDVPLVDHEAAFAGHFAREGYATLMFNDHHANVRGYQLVVDGIVEALDRSGLLPPERAPPASRSADPAPRPSAGLVARGLDQLALAGPPDAPFQLLYSATDGDGLTIEGRHVPLTPDEVTALARLEPSCSGRLGRDGSALLSTPARVRAAAGDAPLRACLLILAEPGSRGPAVTDASQAVLVRPGP